MNFWSSECNHACLNCQVVTKVSEAKNEELKNKNEEIH